MKIETERIFHIKLTELEARKLAVTLMKINGVTEESDFEPEEQDIIDALITTINKIP